MPEREALVQFKADLHRLHRLLCVDGVYDVTLAPMTRESTHCVVTGWCLFPLNHACVCVFSFWGLWSQLVSVFSLPQSAGLGLGVKSAFDRPLTGPTTLPLAVTSIETSIV